MEVVPKEVAFAAAKLDAFNRNRYRIETTGATTAGPSSIVTINLPDAAVLDLRTFRMVLAQANENGLMAKVNFLRKVKLLEGLGDSSTSLGHLSSHFLVFKFSILSLNSTTYKRP